TRRASFFHGASDSRPHLYSRPATSGICKDGVVGADVSNGDSVRRRARSVADLHHGGERKRLDDLPVIKIAEYDLAVLAVDRLGERQVTIAGVRRGPHAAAGNPLRISKELKLTARCWIAVEIEEHCAGTSKRSDCEHSDCHQKIRESGERFGFHGFIAFCEMRRRTNEVGPRNNSRSSKPQIRILPAGSLQPRYWRVVNVWCPQTRCQMVFQSHLVVWQSSGRPFRTRIISFSGSSLACN